MHVYNIYICVVYREYYVEVINKSTHNTQFKMKRFRLKEKQLEYMPLS